MKGNRGNDRRGARAVDQDSQIFPTISVDEWLTDRFYSVVAEADGVSDPF
jgi:hypothetical protein